MKTTLYLTHAVLLQSSPAVRAIHSIIEWMGWPEPEVIVGIKELALLSRGRFNPSSDFALTMQGVIVARNPVDLCCWIDQEGLTPL